MSSININGKQYEKRRYTYDEIKKIFNGKVVVLDDACIENMNLVSGILVDAFNIEEKINRRKKYMIEGKKYTLWDLSPEPIIAGYREYV